MDQAFPSISSAKPIREERKRAEEAEDELFWGPSDSSKSLSSKSPAGWSPQGEGRGPASLPPPSPTHTFSAAKSWAKSSPASGFSLADFAVAKTPKGRKKDVAASPSPKDASKGWSFVSHSPSPPLTGSEVVSLASIQAEEEKARNPKQSRRKQNSGAAWFNRVDVVAPSLQEIQRREAWEQEEREALALIRAVHGEQALHVS